MLAIQIDGKQKQDGHEDKSRVTDEENKAGWTATLVNYELAKVVSDGKTAHLLRKSEVKKTVKRTEQVTD